MKTTCTVSYHTGHQSQLSADTPPSLQLCLTLEALDRSGTPSFCPEGTDTSEK